VERKNSLKEIEVTFYRSRGPGGQRKNRKETAVRVVHIPTGISAIAAESRSQAQNRQRAIERLYEKLEKSRRKKKPRIKYYKPSAVRERELESKRRVSLKKLARRKIFVHNNEDSMSS
jgi:protein subunit release factor A